MGDRGLFDAYEEDFIDQRNSVETKIKIIATLDGPRRQQEIQAVESDIQDMEQSLKSMTLSARNISSNQSLLAKIKEYESDLSKQKTALRKTTMQISALNDRDNLFKGAIKDEHLATSMEQRERLLAATEKLDKTNVMLKDTNRLAQDTVFIGIQTLEHLEEQRSTMENIKEKLRGVNENLGKATKVMRTMARRVVTNKLIMALIILVLLGAVILIVYLKWFSGSGTDPTPVTSSSPDSTTTS